MMGTNQLTEVEFLRFGSNIPGHYWGCCAATVIQCFKGDPDSKCNSQVISGDGNTPIGDNFTGLTQREHFLSRIRFGEFGMSDMPNHAFFAILTAGQISGAFGKKWLAILKECGFEYVRSVSNSVYAGAALAKHSEGAGSAVNHIFMLVRNIGSGNIGDQFTPPKAWTDLPKVKKEAWEFIDNTKELTAEYHKADTEIWNKIGPAKFYTRKQVLDSGQRPLLGGVRGGRLPEFAPDKPAATTPSLKQMTA
jgi:hypothetical protein